MTEETQPVEEVETETVTQPENTEEVDAPEAETNGETPEPSSEIDEKEKARKHFEERQSKRERMEKAERENEYLKQELAKYQNTQTHTKPQVARTVDPNLPDLDRYLEEGKTAQEWGIDFHNYQEGVRKQQSHRQSVANDFASRMSEYSKSVPDVYKYAQAVDQMVGRDVQEAILISEKAPQIIEKIALYPEVQNDINSCNNVYELAKKISKLEAEFEKVEKPPISGAHKPIETVKNSTPAPKVDITKMTGAEYREYMNKKRRG